LFFQIFLPSTKPGKLDDILEYFPSDKILSLGLVDGRNIWKNNYEDSLRIINTVIRSISTDKVWIAPSCSLLHCPYDLALEHNEQSPLNDIKKWLAFSRQKLNELNTIKQLIVDKDNHYDDYLTELIKNAKLYSEKKLSDTINKKDVREKLDSVLDKNVDRSADFKQRIVQQNEKFHLFSTWPV
jgi:5-methyltetrahydropteroyltriglutamate--homocysteine methyltransferase